MKKTQRGASLLLALCMLLALFTGCQSTTTAPATEAPAPEQSAPAQNAPAQNAPAQNAPEQPGPAVAKSLYPVFDTPTTLTAYWSYQGFLSMFGVNQEDVPNTPAFLAAQEATNVVLDFAFVGEESFSTSIQLMWGSGDYYDLEAFGERLYTGGIDKAVDDDILLDIAPYLAEYAPDYLALLNQYPDFKRERTSENGRIISFSEYDESVTRGLVIRGDWLEKLNMDVPRTFDETFEVLKAFKTTYGARNAVMLNSFGGFGTANEMLSGYGLAAAGGTASGTTDLGWFVDEQGKVQCTEVQPAYKEYLTMLNMWWNEGLFTDDFLQIKDNVSEYERFIFADECGFAAGNSFLLDPSSKGRAADPDFNLIPIADITKNPGDKVRMGGATGQMGGSALSISAQTKYPEQCVAYLNWYFTEPGELICNFGVEGTTFTYDANGNPQYTDLILKNPNYPSFIALFINAQMVGTVYKNTTAKQIAMASSQEQKDALTIWPSNRSNDGFLPVATTLIGANEIADYNALALDAAIFSSENVLAFIIGERSLDEFDQFVAQLNGMGVDKMQAMKQSAYEKYMSK